MAGHAAKGFGHLQTGRQADLKETGTEVGAAEPAALLPLQRPELALRLQGGGVKDRVLVGLLQQQAGGVGFVDGVEGDEKRPFLGQVLQPVHPVGDAEFAGLGSLV